MPVISFTSQMYPREEVSPDCPVISVSHDALWCHDALEPFARFYSSLWSIGSKFYTIGNIQGPVWLTFHAENGDDWVAGEFPALRLVGQHLFHGEALLACIEAQKWRVQPSERGYDRLRISAPQR